MQSIQQLGLGGTAISDAGLAHLQTMGGLQLLSLSHMRAITDAGLTWLYGLSNLEMISLEGTSVSKEGIANLQAALPRCQIIY